MNGAKPKPFKSSLIPVTGKYSVRFTISGNSADCCWHPSQPTREEGMAIAACGAYFDARNQAMAEFAAHTGQKVAVIGPGGVVVSFDGSATV
jgi:hypothetical protein